MALYVKGESFQDGSPDREEIMKKLTVFVSMLMFALIFTISGIHAQQQSPQPQAQPSEPQSQVQPSPDQTPGSWYCPRVGSYVGSRGGWQCPWCGHGWGKGRAKMHHRGYGMMHGRSGRGPYQPAPGAAIGKPLTEDQARMLLERYIDNTNNPNLKLGPITSKDGVYEAQVLTKDDSLVDKLVVNKETGWFRSAY